MKLVTFHSQAPRDWDVVDVLIRSLISDPMYDNLEEKRVIERFETPAARQLGEGTRTDHQGTTFWVLSPTQF